MAKTTIFFLAALIAIAVAAPAAPEEELTHTNVEEGQRSARGAGTLLSLAAAGSGASKLGGLLGGGGLGYGGYGYPAVGLGYGGFGYGGLGYGGLGYGGYGYPSGYGYPAGCVYPSYDPSLSGGLGPILLGLASSFNGVGHHAGGKLPSILGKGLL